MSLSQGFKDRLFIKKIFVIAVTTIVAITFCLTFIALLRNKSASYSVVEPDKVLLENLTQELQKSRESNVQLWEE